MIAHIKAFFAFFHVPENSQFDHCECWPCCGSCSTAPSVAVPAISTDTVPITVLNKHAIAQAKAHHHEH